MCNIHSHKHSQTHTLFLFHVIPKSNLSGFKKCNSKNVYPAALRFLNLEEKKVLAGPGEAPLPLHTAYLKSKDTSGSLYTNDEMGKQIIIFNLYVPLKKLNASRML